MVQRHLSTTNAPRTTHTIDLVEKDFCPLDGGRGFDSKKARLRRKEGPKRARKQDLFPTRKGESMTEEQDHLAGE